MSIRMKNKAQVTGIAILFAGVVLLVFTFMNAFLFLLEPLSIVASADLAQVFGEALAPLIQSCVRLMYLGIMGWIGSLLTVRGIPLVKERQIISTERAAAQAEQQQGQITQTEPARGARPAQTEPTVNHKDPDAILIPPESQREE